MRIMDWSGAGKHSGLLAIGLVALAAGLLAVDPVASSSSGPAAVASKTKCKKARWKCAPKRYHLTASGTYSNSQFTQSWSAEVDMRKRRAGPGEVDYTQDGGTLTMSATGIKDFDDHCLHEGSDGEATLNVPLQTVQVPPEGLDEADFGVTFKLIGSYKNTYGLGVGEVQEEFSHIRGTATVTCSSGSSHTHDFPYIDPARAVRALVAPGVVGGSPLRGSSQTRNSFVTWTLTAKK
jgi:hypothetical protein